MRVDFDKMDETFELEKLGIQISESNVFCMGR